MVDKLAAWPGSPLAGRVFALGRTFIAPAEIPVGIITALLGGPFFVWLLVRQGRP